MAHFKEHTEIERPLWLGENWADSSWHNDACAHATLYLTGDESPDGPCVEFWVNYPDPNERELPPLYFVVFQRSYSIESGTDVELHAGDDEGQAKIWERAARTAKTIIADILTEPGLMACKTFSELHDHCDANMLGDMGTALFEEGESHRTAADDPQVLAVEWICNVANAAISIVEAWMKARKEPA